MNRVWLWVRKRLRLLLFVFLCGLLCLNLLAAWLYNRDKAPSGAPMSEVIAPGEDYAMSRIIAGAVQLSVQTHDELAKKSSLGQPIPSSSSQGFNPHSYRRDVHAKTHGCLAAKFKVLDAPGDLKKGLFEKTAEYPAWIRFSNGTPQLNPDSVKDARGMAIKVMGVKGEKLLESEKTAETHDFIMINSPVFFIRTLEEYEQFSSALANGKPTAYFFPSINPLRWHLREFYLGSKSQKAAPASLLTERYYSLSAYALGSMHYVKYGARPCSSNSAPSMTKSGDDFLRANLKTVLEKESVCFEFMVQPQIPGKDMPVEDATVEWSERDSPFIPIAQIEIPKQEFDIAERNAFCENLAFNPWHALPDHRPVGVMNRARKSLYEAIGRYRRAKNFRPIGEPVSTPAEPWPLRFTCQQTPEGCPVQSASK